MLSISDPDFNNLMLAQFGNGGGVYKIIAARHGVVVPINRFLGTDLDGRLYIGKASEFIYRVGILRRTILPNYSPNGHICSRRYKGAAKITEMFPFTDLHIKFFPAENPRELEKALLNEYYQTFGEVPPLNAIG